jgi:hypothetical protein
LQLRQQRRRVATRYDKLATSYLAFVQLASIRLWLAAVNESKHQQTYWFWRRFSN